MSHSGRRPEFGERLKQMLAARRKSQAELADMLGISRSRINNYVTGRSEPDTNTLVQVADALETSVDFLLGRSNGHGETRDSGNCLFPEFVPFCSGRKLAPFGWIPLYRSQHTPSDIPSPNVRPPLGWLRFDVKAGRGPAYRQSYALLVGDDSMKPHLLPGDIAYIQPMVIFHNFIADEPTSEVFAVRLHSSDPIGLSLKKCYIRDNMLVFFCENATYTPYIINVTNIVFTPIVGKLLYIWRSFGQAKGDVFSLINQ